jgi:amino acid transporter
VAALVVIRIVMQFILQAVGMIIFRVRRPELERPFRMWLYPVPAIIALFGFGYILFSRVNFQRELLLAGVLVIVGTAAYVIRAMARYDWPFAKGAD